MKQELKAIRRAAALALGLLAFPAAATEIAPPPRPALEAPDPRTAADLFAMPAIAGDVRLALGRAAAGDLDGAAALLDARIRDHPDPAALQAARAVVAALAGDGPAALEHLAAAARGGLPRLRSLIADPVFTPLAADPELGFRLAALAALPEPDAAPLPRPAPVTSGVTGGVARITAANTAWNPETDRLEPRFAFAPKPDAPILPPLPKTAELEILREHAKRGRAAGNHGDLYDNRDRGHSALDLKRHPQLTAVVYPPQARAADLDYGLADRFLFDQVVFGNSSTAMTGSVLWRSLPRLAMTQPDGAGPVGLWQTAAANGLYVYPAHHDYGEKSGGEKSGGEQSGGEQSGDLFPANTPYILVSHGSSGSDQPFLEAVALILAAFPPETKARLIEENLVVPTVQMVFRRSLRNVTSREDYFSGAAHPAVFEGYNINLARMVSLANSITPDTIPAESRIRVVEEELGTEGVDYFGEGLSEQLFDTPAAVARIWRSRTWQRSMLLSAEDSRDVDGRPLTFHWRLLQGDPAKVKIEPLDGGARARVTLNWHDPFPISEDNPLVSARLDIGLFADNGQRDSAPAILSWYFPPEETRTYAPGPDKAPRIAAIDYAAPAKAKVYADPMLIPRADWRDTYAYDDSGALTGWTRARPAREEERFTVEGARILAPAAEGRPAETVAVAYPLDRDDKGRLEVREIDAGGFP